MAICWKLKLLMWINLLVSLQRVCRAQSNESVLQQCITNFDSTVNYYQKLIPAEVLNQQYVLPLPLQLQEIVTATGFAVNYGKYYKVVKNQVYNVTYVLYQCGAPPPSVVALGVPATTATFQIPVGNPSTDSTIPVGYLELLGQLNKLKLTSSASDFISSSCVLKYMDDNNITEISEEVANITTVKFESSKLPTTLGRYTVSFDATTDPDSGPLKRAEWIKYLGTFFNLEEKAEEIFSHINSSYQCLNASIRGSTTKPSIAWMNFYGGVWSMSNAPYKLQFDSDAGGVNLDATTLTKSFNMSLSSDVELFNEVLKQLDVVIDESYAEDPFSYTFENFTVNAMVSPNDSSIPSVAHKRVWREDKRVGKGMGLGHGLWRSGRDFWPTREGINQLIYRFWGPERAPYDLESQYIHSLDWFEGAIPQPHVVLYDLIGILYPSKGWNQTYFRNVALDEKPVNVSAEVCTRSIDEALPPTVIIDPEIMACVSNATKPAVPLKNAASTKVPSVLFSFLLAFTSSCFVLRL